MDQLTYVPTLGSGHDLGEKTDRTTHEVCSQPWRECEEPGPAGGTEVNAGAHLR